MIEDSIIYPTMIELSACLCQEIQNSELPEPCYCGPIVGPDAIYDYCSGCGDVKCGGQAWVRLVEAYPSSLFPTPEQQAQNCFSPLAFTIEVGIARCRPMGTNNNVRGFSPPTMEQNVDSLRLQLADIAAMRRAIQCCFGKSDLSYVMGTYTQATPAGDCLGGVINVIVWSA